MLTSLLTRWSAFFAGWRPRASMLTLRIAEPTCEESPWPVLATCESIDCRSSDSNLGPFALLLERLSRSRATLSRYSLNEGYTCTRRLNEGLERW